jgi:GT2 family glycosyltransferase
VSRVSVVIPNYNGLAHLPECFASLDVQTFRDFEVIVVDNASADGSLEWLSTQRPDVRVIARAVNGGFSTAVNAGIRASSAPYIALLNNDTAAEPQWLASLVGALDELPDYDIAASLMLLYYETGLVNAAGDVYRFRNLAGENRGMRRPESEFASRERVFGACAGAALYRRGVFDEVGLFDEDFFLMYEDVDLDMRCLIAGKKTVYVPAARIRHKLGATISAAPSRDMVLLAWRNQAVVVAKDLPAGLVAAAPFVWVARLVRETLLPTPGDVSVRDRVLLLPARVRAQTSGFRAGLRKRESVWSRRAVSVTEVRRWLRVGAGPIEPR